MKKPYAFNVLSMIKCATTGCNRRLKKRIVEQKQPHHARFCYKCGKAIALTGQRRPW